VTDWSVRGAMSFYGVLEMTGDEAHWRGLGRGIRLLLERRVVQVPYQGHEALYHSLSAVRANLSGLTALLSSSRA